MNSAAPFHIHTEKNGPITASNFIANITKLIADFSLNYLPSRFIICKNKKEGEICTNQNSIQYLKFLLLQAA